MGVFEDIKKNADKEMKDKADEQKVKAAVKKDK